MMKIVAIAPRAATGTRLSASVSPRQFEAIDEFAAAVGEAAGTSVAVIEGEITDAPVNAFLLVFGARDLRTQPNAARRAILVNADRSTVLRQLEELDLAGAVEKQRYFRWRTARQDEDGGGLFGRIAVADAIGASLSPGPFQTARYGLFGRSSYRDLPSLLSAYLAHLAI